MHIPEVVPEQYKYLYIKAVEEGKWFLIETSDGVLRLLLSPDELGKYGKYTFPVANVRLVDPFMFILNEKDRLEEATKLYTHWNKKVSDYKRKIEGKKQKYILEIEKEKDPRCPRKEFDNLGKMICWHRRYTLGDDHDYESPDYFDKKDYAVCLPVYMYDHSGLTISTSPFDCRWDSGQLGFIVVTKEDIISTYGSDCEENIQKATESLKLEISVYDLYLRGEVYGYVLKEMDGDVLDSCYGFYGDDVYKNGMLDNIGIDVSNLVIKYK